MNKPDEDGSRAAASAATLLFQAPEFKEPEARDEKPGRAENNEAPEERKEGGGSQPRRGRQRVNSGADEGKKKKGPQAEGGKSKADAKGTAERQGGKKKSREESGGAEKNDKEKQGGSSGGQPKDKGADAAERAEDTDSEGSSSHRRRRRRPRQSGSGSTKSGNGAADQVQALKGSTRLEAKRMRRREGRREGRRRQSVTEAEFLARRESVDREMVVRHKEGLDQIAVLEDDVLVEHYVTRKTQQSIVGNIYLGRVQNVLPSMEAAFVDIGRGRNAVLYAGEVNWDALGMEGKPRRIEQALKSGDSVLVQVTKDPIGHKGARLTSQITLAGRYLVLVPGSSMLGISRKLPDPERQRLKKILREVVPEDAGVIVRTAAEGTTEEQLKSDIDRLMKQWAEIQRKEKGTRKAPQLLRAEPELVVRVVRDIFNEDFNKLVVQGDETWETVSSYVNDLSPELNAKLENWRAPEDIFEAKRIDQQLAKGMDRKVWLPSGGTLVIDRTEALTVIDVNTGKFVGSGGTLEETITRNNLEAAEEIVRQLRLRDIGGIIIIDFVDMVLESNRELVLRRMIESLGRDRTRHQVTEITSLGLVQMTRKRVGEGLVEAFSTTCEACEGRGFIVHDHPVETPGYQHQGSRKRKGRAVEAAPKKARAISAAPERAEEPDSPVSHVGEEKVKSALSAIAAATVGNEKEGAPEAPADAKTAPTQQESPAGTPRPRAVRRRRRATSAPAAIPASKDQDTAEGSAEHSANDQAADEPAAGVGPAPEKTLEIVLPDGPEQASTVVISRPPARRRAVATAASPSQAATTAQSAAPADEDASAAVLPASEGNRDADPSAEESAASSETSEKAESARQAVRDLFETNPSENPAESQESAE